MKICKFWLTKPKMWKGEVKCRVFYVIEVKLLSV